MIRIIAGALFLMTFTSCTHYYYIPATKNVPLFKEKNEYRANFSFGGGDETNTFDMQAAYSLTDKFAVAANFMAASGGDKSSPNWGRGNYVDAAVGYYKPITPNLIFETFAGIGGSSQHHQYGTSQTNANVVQITDYGYSKLSFMKYFVQPSIGLTFDAFDVAVTSGFSYLTFGKVDNGIIPTDDHWWEVAAVEASKNSYLFEPAITLRGGWKYVKCQMQFLTSVNLSYKDLPYERTKASFGVSFAFAERFKKKK